MIAINMTYPVLVYADEDDESVYNAIVPDMDGCFASGKGEQEALEKIKEEMYFILGGKTVSYMDGIYLDGSMRPIWNEDEYFRLPSSKESVEKRFARGKVVMVEISLCAHECDIPF